MKQQNFLFKHCHLGKKRLKVVGTFKNFGGGEEWSEEQKFHKSVSFQWKRYDCLMSPHCSMLLHSLLAMNILHTMQSKYTTACLRVWL